MFRFRIVARVVIFLVCSMAWAAFADGQVKCDFETELGKIYSEAEAKRANLAVQQSQLLDQIEKLVETLPDHKKPIAEQFDKAGLAAFEKLRERQMILMNVSLSESKRMRDMQFFRTFVILAEKDVKWPEIPPSNHPDFIPYTMLVSARQFLQDKVKVSGTRFDQCNLEASIQVMEQEMIDRLNAMDSAPINELNALQSRLQKKYKTKDLDPKRMSEPDRKAMVAAVEKIEPMQRLINLAKDYEILKALAKASQLIYDADKEDILTFGADPTKIGTTLTTKANAGQYGDLIKHAHAVMRVIDKKIPCEDALDIEKMADKVKQIKPGQGDGK
jgi:hypothetical protein